MKFVFLTEFFESSSLALQMKLREKQDIRVWVSDKNSKKILDGMIEKESNFVQFMGDGNIFVTDDADSGKLADALRKRGELVFGGSAESDKWENDRSAGEKVAKAAGLNVPKTCPFQGNQAFDKAIEFIQKHKGQWVVKQNGDADKSLSTVGKFDGGEDVVDKLKDMKHLWTENVDFVLQERVDGHEIAIEGWFNGKDWLTDKSGQPVFIINWEHKKKSDGDTGRTTGETCTLAIRASQRGALAKELLKLTGHLRKVKYIGNIDINCILSKKDMKFYFLEFTNRFGYPALNFTQEIFKTPWKDIIAKSVKGENGFLEVDARWVVVVVLQVPPYPFDAGKEANNAKGQRVYFLDNGKLGGDGLTMEKLRHIHPYEVRFDHETAHFLATGDTGYLLTVTAVGDNPKAANDAALKFLTDNIYTSNMDFRKDCGVSRRVKESIEVMTKRGYL